MLSAKAKRIRTKDTTTVTILVTDQGNGATYCDTCEFRAVDFPAICPSCARRVVGISRVDGDLGGSDF